MFDKLPGVTYNPLLDSPYFDSSELRRDVLPPDAFLLLDGDNFDLLSGETFQLLE